MKFDKKYISGRFTVVLIVVMIVCLCILGQTVYTMTVKRDFWNKLSEVYVADSLVEKPNRGNILSADGQLLASSLPDYKIYMDFVAGDSIKDSILVEKMDSICEGLHEIIPSFTASEFRKRLEHGRKIRSRYYPIYPWRITYIQLNEVKKLPLFNMKNRNISGLIIEERNNRKKPFGSLAARTLGEMYGAKDSARSGLELAYDSLLRGKDGRRHRKKVRQKFLDIMDQEPQDGYDIVTTIDVNMQDICESALEDELRKLEASMGVVVLMEVKTGDVKAIVNLQRYDDGNYYEARNYALASLMEPGSTFKTASIMVALDDGKITINDHVDTGCGVYNMHGSLMKDHNWSRGGYQVLSVPEVLMYSSNIGVSRLIDENYHNEPEKFVDGLYRIGIAQHLGLPFVGMADPVIRRPNKYNWSATALPWMSIGYETQIPPISTVTFYNAIANNGRMVKPRLVKAVQKDGEVIEEFPVEVLKEKICKESTLKDIRYILEKVVSEGLGKRAGNPHFKVSGKTSTAQVSQGKAGYRSGRREYLVSFCGYYPSDDPKYTCIVAIRKSGLPASGGTMAGSVFAKIAERVFAKHVTTDISMARDSNSVFVPDVKNGDIAAARHVLEELNVPSKVDMDGGNIWGTASIDGSSVNFRRVSLDDKYIPDMKGMGARDAVYALESRGVKARIVGVGKVKEQSVPAGTKISAGETVVLHLH